MRSLTSKSNSTLGTFSDKISWAKKLSTECQWTTYLWEGFVSKPRSYCLNIDGTARIGFLLYNLSSLNHAIVIETYRSFLPPYTRKKKCLDIWMTSNPGRQSATLLFHGLLAIIRKLNKGRGAIWQLNKIKFLHCTAYSFTLCFNYHWPPVRHVLLLGTSFVV